MIEVTELHDKRLNDLETIVWDFPNLINTRFERFDAETDANRIALADNTSRLVQVERRLNALTTDMRDMRAGLTRHMLDQSRQMTAVVAKVDGLEAKFDGLEAKFDGLEAKFDRLEAKFAGLEAKFDRLEAKFDGLEARMMAALQDIVKRLPK
jgi:chromosome segregation ATPase